MNLKELAAAVKLSEPIVSKHLAPFRIKVEEVDWQNLVVPDNGSMTLNAEDPAMRARVKNLQPKSIAEVREWVGLPQRVYSPREIPGFGAVSGVRRLAAAAAVKIEAADLHSISPTATLIDLAGLQRTKLMTAARELVFGSVSAADAATPLYRAAEAMILKRVIPTFFLRDIVVGHNATLTIASNVAAVVAHRIMVYSGGRIVTSRYSHVSFHCYSVAGRLP